MNSCLLMKLFTKLFDPFIILVTKGRVRRSTERLTMRLVILRKSERALAIVISPSALSGKPESTNVSNENNFHFYKSERVELVNKWQLLLKPFEFTAESFYASIRLIPLKK